MRNRIGCGNVTDMTKTAELATLIRDVVLTHFETEYLRHRWITGPWAPVDSARALWMATVEQRFIAQAKAARDDDWWIGHAPTGNLSYWAHEVHVGLVDDLGRNEDDHAALFDAVAAEWIAAAENLTEAEGIDFMLQHIADSLGVTEIPSADDFRRVTNTPAASGA